MDCFINYDWDKFVEAYEETDGIFRDWMKSLGIILIWNDRSIWEVLGYSTSIVEFCKHLSNRTKLVFPFKECEDEDNYRNDCSSDQHRIRIMFVSVNVINTDTLMQCFTEPSMCHHLRPRNGYYFEPIFSESFANKSVYIDINFFT